MDRREKVAGQGNTETVLILSAIRAMVLVIVLASPVVRVGRIIVLEDNWRLEGGSDAAQMAFCQGKCGFGRTGVRYGAAHLDLKSPI